ncbi:LAME_0F20186g1_1 [Lachancea meyersii CBS 8951]|uniref:LAME_0F20186g1_1 n=1 Tax=Lachancea meyersii CBS 8951 TaxID=1266667 RepID=A0A1G4K205_9SACH|nr:LAME_0F20186g1_1 [Lachancea meyersii CBS 8951]
MTSSWKTLALAFHSKPVSQSLQLLIACVSETNRFPWMYEDEPESSFYSKACGGYMPYMQTAMNCYVSLTEGADLSLFEQLDNYKNACNALTGTNFSEVDIQHIWRNGTHFLQNSHIVGGLERLTAPIVLSEDVISATYLYCRYTFYNFVAAFNFNLVINGTVAILILCAIWARVSSSSTKFVRHVRSKYLVPALFDTTHHTESTALSFYKILFPTRGEALALSVFLLINTVLALYNYPVVSSNMDTKLFFMVRCLANRCGGLSFGLIPLTILLAGRNTLLSQLTGIPYSSFLFFHKWAARTMTFYATMHSLLWIFYACVRLKMSFWVSFFNFDYWTWGVWAALAATALIFHSIHTFKARQYEVFLTIHITLGIIFLVGCLKHCATFGWLGWIYLGAGFWMWDRVARLWRVLVNFGGYKNAFAYALPAQDELFKITVPYVESERFKFFPGCYGFIYILERRYFWQSHPFTLMRRKDNIEIIVRAKEGITRDLYERLPSDGTKVPLRVAIEGPYGHEAPLESYDNVLLITSGAGVPGPISYLSKAVERMSERGNYTFVWIVPTESFMDTMKSSLMSIGETMRAGCSKRQIKIQIFVTRPQLDARLSEWRPKEIDIYRYKPDVAELISTFCKNASGSIGIVSCANPGLDDRIRRHVSCEILSHDARIDYFDELQVW